MQDAVQTSDFSNSERMDLAGNAFCAFVIYPLLLALATFAPLADAQKFANGVRVAKPAPAGYSGPKEPMGG